MKVFEFAKEIGTETLTLMDKIRVWGLPVKSHMATLTEEQMAEIRSKLMEDSSSTAKVTKKKVVKKAAVKKAPATTKKVVAKPTTAKTVASQEPKETATKKKVARKSSVIRRVAAHSPEVIAEQARIEAEAAAKAATEQAQVEVDQEDLGVAPANELTSVSLSPEAPVPGSERQRKNIVGRMDLTRVTRPPAGAQGGYGQGTAQGAGARPMSQPNRTGPGRNIRTGFVAAEPIFDQPSSVDFESERLKEEKKKKAGAGRELPVQNFSAADFRKREVIFQPKKKKSLTGISKQTQITTPAAHKRVVRVQNQITVNELAQQMNLKAPALIKKLMGEGVMATMNTPIDFDTVALIVPEFGFEAQNVQITEEELITQMAYGNLDKEPVARPPVVTVMGHVDHGKTTLLDAIRNADVASGEAGGITQHIGAYSVKLADGRVTTFIDTPGHAAFTAMRARGANVTDIVIIVVAADDGMMPQTEEAISHAQAAKVPIIVAINKMDKPGANPDRIKQQLSDKQLIPEEWGGETIFVPVSALKKEGIKQLIENIHLVADVLELKANPDRSGEGLIVESKMERGKGNVATVLVKNGTVRVGDIFVAGTVMGRVRSMTTDRGELVKEAGPGMPVEITGFDESPGAGDRFDVSKDEELAKKLVEVRKSKQVVAETPNSKMSLDVIFSKAKAGDLKELNLVLKADVVGSVEAIRGMLEKLATEEVKVKIIHSGVGGISENDVLLAATSGGLVIGFNVRPDTAAQKLAKERSVEIKCYSIIYNLADEIKQAMAGLLSPKTVEETMGAAEVRETFVVPKIGTIAGCFVVNGKVARNSLLRLVRDGRIIYEGKISSLKRFKDDAKEVQTGYECGIGIENFNDIKVGDVIEAYATKEIARTID